MPSIERHEFIIDNYFVSLVLFEFLKFAREFVESSVFFLTDWSFVTMDKWQGKNALVTGANSGIGAAITKKLLQLGMTVAGLDKTTENLTVSYYVIDFFENYFPSKIRRKTVFELGIL